MLVPSPVILYLARNGLQVIQAHAPGQPSICMEVHYRVSKKRPREAKEVVPGKEGYV